MHKPEVQLNLKTHKFVGKFAKKNLKKLDLKKGLGIYVHNDYAHLLKKENWLRDKNEHIQWYSIIIEDQPKAYISVAYSPPFNYDIGLKSHIKTQSNTYIPTHQLDCVQKTHYGRMSEHTKHRFPCAMLPRRAVCWALLF